MRGESFSVPVEGGQVSGWIDGHGTPTLLLHGGPGLSYDYVDQLAAEIGDGYQVAAYQQRGIEPSMLDGPYDLATHLDDVTAVLDALGWQMAYLVGHSWGGHLALHAAVAMPDRLLGALAVDPVGAVGDGGMKLFNDEMLARCPESVRAKVEELDEAALSGSGTADDGIESLRLYWPAYFADWDSAPPMPPTQMCVASYAEGSASIINHMPELEAALPSIAVPVGIVAGAASPMPVYDAAVLTAKRIPGGWVETIDDAGHFPWFEKPGCVRAGLDRLAGV
jgi:pimeloyl-ACP methyl ester carboxylesterase